MNKLLIRIIFLFFILSQSVLAGQAEGIGAVAQNMMEPVSVLSDFVHSACFVIGASFLFACVIKYIEHRRSPLMVPISTVIFLLIAGIALILLPFISLLTDSAVSYTLLQQKLSTSQVA